MRILTTLLLALASCGAAAAQTAQPSQTAETVQTVWLYAEAPGMAVVRNSWGVRAHNPAPDQDPLAASREQLARDQIRQDEATRRAGGTVVGESPHMSVWRNTPPKAAAEYFFEAEVKNTGTKTVRRLIWEYVFFDRATGAEVGYRAFRYEQEIKPGRSAKVVGTLPLEPEGVADATKVTKEAQGKYVERIFFRRIEYDDDTTWARPAKSNAARSPTPPTAPKP
jgi:hypothetical protein